MALASPEGWHEAVDAMWHEAMRAEAESAAAWCEILAATEDGRGVTHEWDKDGNLTFHVGTTPTATASGRTEKAVKP